jgi:hypothetical protein
VCSTDVSVSAPTADPGKTGRQRKRRRQPADAH